MRLPFGKAAESSALIPKILARDSELLHFGLKCGAFKPQAGRGAASARYYASGVSQNPENMFPLGSMKAGVMPAVILLIHIGQFGGAL